MPFAWVMHGADPLVLVGALLWCLMGAMVAWGCCRWWQEQRALDERDADDRER